MSVVMPNLPDFNAPAIHQSLARVESIFNVAGYIPVVNLLSGAVRWNLGGLLLIAAVVTAATHVVLSYYASKAEHKTAEWNKAVELLTGYGSHGLADMFRAAVETMFPFCLGGLALCLPYDHFWKQRYCYKYELRSPPVQTPTADTAPAA